MLAVRCYALGRYVAKGTEQTEKQRGMQELVWRLKDGGRYRGKDPAHVVARYLARGSCSGLMNPFAILVPMPPHTKTPERATMREWPAARLADAMVKAGLGVAMMAVLRRRHDVAAAHSGPKPTVDEHYASFELRDRVLPPEQVILIDDVLTKGTQMIAAQRLFNERGRHAMGFAAAFTKFNSGDNPDGRAVFECEWSPGAKYPVRRLTDTPFWEEPPAGS